MNTPQTPLAHFRAECYQSFGLRRDALSDLLDAVLTGEPVSSLVRCSLTPGYAHQWSSVYDALSDGTLDPVRLHALVTAHLPPPDPGQRPLWAIDGSTWPRPEAKTSPERTCCRFVTPGLPASGIVPGWEYQWLVAIPEERGSWVLPLDLRRRAPEAGTATALAIAQLTAVLASAPLALARPVVVVDSHYDVPQLVRAGLAVDLLARLACNRRFFRPPPPRDPHGTRVGRPRVHGPVFRLGDPATQGAPTAVQVYPDPDYGTVELTRWDDLHTAQAPAITVTVVKIAVAHLPRRSAPPAPLWLCWHGETCPEDLRVLWHWYQRRFTIEHAFRFLKQDLGWTRPHLRAPAAADRWSWVVALVLWELWLARPLITEHRLPWERAPATGRPVSPGRVRRGLGALLRTLGSPARPPQPRGKSPGRQLGACPPPAPRFLVVKRPPRQAA